MLEKEEKKKKGRKRDERNRKDDKKEEKEEKKNKKKEDEVEEVKKKRNLSGTVVSFSITDTHTIITSTKELALISSKQMTLQLFPHL